MPKRKVTKNQLADFWFENYCTEHCTLCGNSGVIDSRGVKTATGLEVGRRNFCVCPNGQALKRGYSPFTCEEVYTRLHAR